MLVSLSASLYFLQGPGGLGSIAEAVGDSAGPPVSIILSIVSAIASLGSVGVLVFKARSDRRKTDEEADDLDARARATISQATITVLDPLLQESKRVQEALNKERLASQRLANAYEARIGDLVRENAALTIEIQLLRAERSGSSASHEGG